MRTRSSLTTFECIAVALVVLALWMVLAGEITAPTVLMGLAVAIPAAAWARLLNG